MRLSAETHHLLEKRLQQSLQPLHILGCAIIATAIFAFVYYVVSFDIRFADPSAVFGVVLLVAAAAAAVTVQAVLLYRHHRNPRGWIALAVCMWAALPLGVVIGDLSWYHSMINYYNYQDMASYVNIDPFADKGQSYMDAGRVYFKDGSFVQQEQAIAFRNGHTYCVAPIVSHSLVPNDGGVFQVPPSGTVDWWAVGTDCCGRNGNMFECGAVHSRLARSGLRVLNDNSRSMYLLAVQEWSASTGLPVRHPVFFEWVKDPIAYTENIQTKAWQDYSINVVICFLVSLVVSFVLHLLLQHKRVS